MFPGAAQLCVQPVAAIGWLAGAFTVMMTIGLFTMILSRERFTQGVKSLEDTNPLAYISPDILKFRHSFQITLPKCAVVLPVKGVRDDSYANWQSQVTSMYGGPLDFIFVVEAEDDPAYPHIERLIREHADANIRLLVAGRTWYCSQKMHNQLHGFEAVLRTAAKYVILLDDDIHLHPGTIRIWVEEMESDPKAVVASGYTFDWVGPSVTGMAPYLWMMWRIVASVAFHHVHDRPGFIWGGAMMFRTSELKRNVCGLMDAWTDGGYSEDFATLSLARYHGRTNCVPKAALFPSEVGEVTMPQLWNYLKRQIFVVTSTFASPHQRYLAYGAQGYSMAMGICTSAALVTACPLAALLALHAAHKLSAALLAGGGGARRAPGAGAVWAAVWSEVLGEEEECLEPAIGACAFLLALSLQAYACKRVVRAYAELCTTLSPMDRPVLYAHMPLWRIALAYLGYCVAVPLMTVYCYCCATVEWAGVRYTFRSGKVHQVHRRDAAGAWYSQSREQSMERALRAAAEQRLADHGLR